MQEKIGVVLLNLGGPDSLEAVEPFLSIFSTTRTLSIFRCSFLFRKRLAKLISGKRHPRIQEQYKQIGGKSPLKDFTLGQARLLEQKLNEKISRQSLCGNALLASVDRRGSGRNRKRRHQKSHSAAALPAIFQSDDRIQRQGMEKTARLKRKFAVARNGA